MYDYNRISVAQPKVQDITPTEPEWKKGFAGFADEMQALGGGAVALAGQATGMEGVRDWGLDVYERNMEESTAGWQAPNVAKIEDIRPFETGGMDRLGDWAAYHGTKGLANVASLALSGGIGGAIAKGATKRAVKEIAKSQVGANRMGRIVTKKIQKDAVDDVRRNVTRGAAAGGFVGAFGMEGGGAFGQQVGGGVAPEDALLPALGVGTVNAALELVAPYQIAKKLGLVGKAREGIAAVIPKDRTLAKKAVELAGKVVKGGASASATEGFTEGLQELVQLAGERWAKDEELLADLSPEDRSQIMNAAAAGALVGGGVGGVTGPFVQEPTPAPEVQPPETGAEPSPEIGPVPSPETGMAPTVIPGESPITPTQAKGIDEATKAAATQAGQEAGTPETGPKAGPEGATPETPSARDEQGAPPLREVAGLPSPVQELGVEEIQAVPVSPEVETNQTTPASFPEASAWAFDVEEIEAVPTADMQLKADLAEVARDVQLGILDKNEAEKVAAQKSKEWQQRLENQARETRKKQRAIEREQIGVLGEKAFERPSTGTRDEQLRLNRIAKENSNVIADIYKKATAQGVPIDDPSVSSAMQKLTKTDDVSSRWWNGLSDDSKKVMGQKVGYAKADLGERSWTDLPPAVRNRLVQKLTGERQNLNLLRSEIPSRAAQKVVPRAVQEVEAALSDELGRNWATRAKKAGMLNILDEVGPNGRQADYNQETGEITIYAKSLGEGPIAAVALHEGSHATMDELLGGRLGEAAREVFDRGAQEAKAGQETNAATAARKAEQVHYRWKAMQLQELGADKDFLGKYDALTEIEQSVTAKELVNDAWGKLDQEVRTPLDERANEILNEEAVAYYVEGSAGTADGLLRRIVNRIKAEWLASAPGQTFAKMRLSPKIDDGTAVALARKATKYAVDLREEMDRRGAPSAEGMGNTLESFVGEQAKIANQSALGNTKQAIAGGATPEQAYQTYGWFQGDDGKWRFEIDDSKAQILQKVEKGVQYTLPQLISHPTLFEAHPVLKQIIVSGEKLGDGLQGEFQSNTWTIRINPADQSKSLLLHEVQHAIQVLEGFSTGDTYISEIGDLSETYEDLIRNLARDAKKRFDQVSSEVETPTKDYSTDQATQLIKRLEKLNKERKYYQDKVEALEEGEIDPEFQAYFNMDAEVEARNVERRMKLTPEERVRVHPNETRSVPRAETLVPSATQQDSVLESKVWHAGPNEWLPELDEIAKKANAPVSSLERMSGVLEDSTLASMRDFADSWVSSPLSEHYDEVTSPKLLNKLKHYYVEKFNDLWQMSKESATKFNLAPSKKASAQKDFEKEFIHPWRDLMVKLSEDMSKDGKKYSVEDLNDAWASWSVVNDNLNVLLARRNSNESLDQLNKEIFSFEKTLDAGDPIRVRLKELRLEWEKGRKNLLAGKTWEGTDPVSDDGVTPRVIMSAEAQHKMMEKLEELFDAPVEGTKVWQASEKLQELRMEWEMMKYQGSGLATPDTASQVPEVRVELEKIIRLHGDRAPKNAYELHDAVKGNASFLAAVPKAKEIAKKGRDALVKGELITREEADAMGDMYKHWMPLQREDYDYDESVKKLFGRGQGSGKPQTRAGTSKVNPPVHTMQNLMASFDASITAMEGNLARKYLADEIQANPERWENWFEVTQDKDAQRSMGKYGFIQTRKAGGEPVDIPFYRNGERWLIKPNTANNRAVMLSNAIQNLDSQELGPVFKMMNKVNSWIRWTNISASPAFLLMNAPRDYFTAMLNLKGTELADFTKDVRKEVGPSLKALNNHFRKGIDDPEIREWEEAGGRISFVESLRPNDETWGSLEAQIKHRQGGFNFGPGMEANFGPGVGVAVSKGRDFLERLETINIMTENVMRYSTWKVAKQKFLDQGMTEQQAKDKAALLSKDVTTNFDRKGLRAQTLGTYWLFYNATVQGNAQVIRNMFEGANKQKLWGALAGVAAFAFINDQLGAELSDDEDGDGRSDWDSTPEWKKEKFGRIAGSNVLWPGEESTFATVPLPWVFNTVWRFGEMVSESMRGVKDPTEIPADMVGLMLNTFNPIGGSDTTPMQMGTPTAADPIVQILENTSAFGRPLGPTQYPGQEFTPDSELAWSNTPPRYKWLARQINDITGGTPAEKGLVDWRPSTYKVLADTLMGGGGRFLEQIVGSGFTAATGKAPEVKDVPLVKPFLFAPGDPIEAEKYHERMAKVERAKHAEKTFMKGPQRDLMELQRVRADYAGELRMVGMASDVERQLKDLRKQLRMAQVRGQDSRVEFLKGKMEKAQERFNKTWASRVGN